MAKTLLSLYAKKRSPRLEYVLQWIFRETWGLRWEWASDPEQADIVYGAIHEGKYCLPSSGILFEKGIPAKKIHWGDWDSMPVFFQDRDQAYPIPFDLFGAVFYCLSRYEEYGAAAQDAHGRFPPTQSCLYAEGRLLRPLVDEWIQAFGEHLKQRGWQLYSPRFQFLPTYDIDMAYLYRHHSPWRILGKWARLCMKSPPSIPLMFSVLLGRRKDPYDSFEGIWQLEAAHQTKSIGFFLLAKNPSSFDRNHPAGSPAMRELIHKWTNHSQVGLHPSYYSLDEVNKAVEEKRILESILSSPIYRSRQHYIRWKHPRDFRKILALGIREDYSMGHANHIGFRAGTSRSFLWYDLDAEKTTELRIFPFCFMDTTARFYHQWSAPIAFEALENLARKVHATQGLLLPIFHNNSLGDDSGWKGWPEAYARFYGHWASFSNIDPSAHTHQGE